LSKLRIDAIALAELVQSLCIDYLLQNSVDIEMTEKQKKKLERTAMDCTIISVIVAYTEIILAE